MKAVATFVTWLFSIVDRIFNEHKGVRRGVVLWGLWLVSAAALPLLAPDVFVTLSEKVQLFILTAVFGFPGLAIGFYKWTRAKENEEREAAEVEAAGLRQRCENLEERLR